jgi:hypothetical protein
MTKSLALKTLLSTIKKKWFKDIWIYNIMLRGAEYPVSSNETDTAMYWFIFLLTFYFLNIYLLTKKQYKDN